MKHKILIVISFISILLSFISHSFAQGSDKDTVWVRYTVDDSYMVKISKTNKYIAKFGTTHTFFHDFITGNEIHRIEGNGHGYFINNDNQFIRLNKNKNGIEIIDLMTWQVFDTLENDGKSLGQFTDVSNDEKYFVSIIPNGIRIWDIGKKKILLTKGITYNEQDLIKVKFNNLTINCDNTKLYANIVKTYKSGPNEIIKSYLVEYNFSTIDSINTYEMGTNYRISNNCKYYSTNFFASTDGVKIYDLNTKALLWMLPIKGTSITGMEFSPDYKYFITSSGASDYVMSIWDMYTGKLSFDYHRIGGGFGPIDISKDGKYIAMAAANWLYLYNGIYSTSVPKDDNKIQILFPNPTTGIATIKYFQKFPEIIKIILSDINGNQIKTLFNKFIESGEQKFELNVSDLAIGIYFISIKNQHQSITFKLIINK